MKINAISNACSKAQNLSFGRHQDEDVTSNIDENNYPRVSNSRMRTAVKAMALAPLFALPLASCNKTEVKDSCGPLIVVISNGDTITSNDTTYTDGLLYNLPSFTQPVKNSNGDSINRVVIPSAQAFVPHTLKANSVQPVMNKFIKYLGITPSTSTPAEGKNQAVSSELPMQFTLSDQKNATVTSYKLDGFRSSDSMFAYDSRIFNSSGNLIGSKHQDIVMLDDNSLLIEETDNFNKNEAPTKTMLRLEDGVINKYINITSSKYEVAGSYVPNGNNSVKYESENGNKIFSNIKVKETALH